MNYIDLNTLATLALFAKDDTIEIKIPAIYSNTFPSGAGFEWGDGRYHGTPSTQYLNDLKNQKLAMTLNNKVIKIV
jgi:hypothetical protein